MINTNTTAKLPVFPLDLFLLPGGISRLRIFEPRYLKMVSLANSLGGFVISSEHQGEQQLARWGSWVEIIDFNKGEDGILEIDVKCKTLVDVILLSDSADQLQYATVSEIKHWSKKQATTQCVELSNSLNSFIKSHDLLNNLYLEQLKQPISNNPYWVVSRWLELLPINFQIKSQFIYQSSYVDAKKLVNSIIYQ